MRPRSAALPFRTTEFETATPTTISRGAFRYKYQGNNPNLLQVQLDAEQGMWLGSGQGKAGDEARHRPKIGILFNGNQHPISCPIASTSEGNPQTHNDFGRQEWMRKPFDPDVFQI